MAFVYSFCFWFSLRLGGIIIGFFSLFHGLLTLAAFAYAHTRVTDVQYEIDTWLRQLNLAYTRYYLENFREDPDKYLTLGMTLTIIYLILCVLFIYGAYTLKNYLMVGFILAELIRLLVLSSLVVTWLLILKQNSMDIGLLIGASVAGGFLLLGMFYLWVCAANLPVLINEMERDEQAAIIEKLQLMLKEQRPYNRDAVPFVDSADSHRGIFMVSRYRRLEKPLAGSRIPVSFYGR